MRKGVTVFEMVIVIALANLVLWTTALLMQRTRTTFQKTTDVLNAEVLQESIVGKLRSDIRRLTRIKECKNHLLVFTAHQKDREIEIRYEYDEIKRSLIRTDSSRAGLKFDFHGANQIQTFLFQPKPCLASFTCLNVAMQIIAQEKKGIPPTTLAFVGQFFAPCKEPFFLSAHANE